MSLQTIASTTACFVIADDSGGQPSVTRYDSRDQADKEATELSGENYRNMGEIYVAEVTVKDGAISLDVWRPNLEE